VLQNTIFYILRFFKWKIAVLKQVFFFKKIVPFVFSISQHLIIIIHSEDASLKNALFNSVDAIASLVCKKISVHPTNVLRKNKENQMTNWTKQNKKEK
jgi:predicted amidophosphoribosyltransferase